MLEPLTMATVAPQRDPMDLAMLRMEHKLNVELGFAWWRHYIAAAFWSNVSTPINLAIALLSALNAAEAGSSGGILSRGAAVGVAVSGTVLAVVNTFFRPHVQMSENVKRMGEWTVLGNRYEDVYFSENAGPEDLRRRLDAYKAISVDVNKLQNSVDPDLQNFLTDVIHAGSRSLCLNRRDRWLDLEGVETPQPDATP